MRVATWNVNSLRARMERVVPWLEESSVDVVCLQETKMADAAFDDAPFRDLGYEVIHHGDGQWNGVALLSKVGLVDPLAGFGSLGEEHGCRIIGAVCGGIRVFSVYVPNGRSLDDPHYAIKLEWLRSLRAHLDSVCDPASSVIVTGDFNIAPRDRDVYDSAHFVGMTHVSPEERDALAHVCGFPLIDAAAHLDPDAVAFTWWDYRNLDFVKGRGMRIDLALVTPTVAARLMSVEVDRTARKGTKPSDHAPVIVTLRDP